MQRSYMIVPIWRDYSALVNISGLRTLLHLLTLRLSAGLITGFQYLFPSYLLRPNDEIKVWRMEIGCTVQDVSKYTPPKK